MTKKTPTKTKNETEFDQNGSTELSTIQEKRELKKAVEVVHITGRLTKTQKNIYNNMVFYAFKNLRKESKHKVSTKKLMQDVQFNSNNVSAFKEAVRTIVTTGVELDLLDDSKGAGWGIMTLLSSAKIYNGVTEFTFSEDMIEILDDPKVFSIVNLAIQNLFDSVHAMNLYDTVLRFRNVRSTGFIPLEKWRKIIGAEDECYKTFKTFNYAVLKPAIEEINRKGEIIIEPEFKRLGRKVEFIKFTIEEKYQAGPKAVEAYPERQRARERIQAFGLSAKEADAEMAKYDITYVNENLDVVEERVRNTKRKISNYSAYLKKALEEDWRPGVVTIDQQIGDEQKDNEAERLLKEQELEKEKKLQAEKSKAVKAKTQKFFKSKSYEEQRELEQEFVNHLNTDPAKNKFVLTYYRQKGLANTIVQEIFNIWLSKKLA